MKRVTVRLTEAEADGLRRLAAETRRPQADLMRVAVRELLGQVPERTFHSIGRGSSGAPTKNAHWSPDEAYEKVTGRDFKEFLITAPDLEALHLERSRGLPREIHF
jgi:hypothetical protein